ncbi:putative E3 ubiquitin ligase complex SCF subunit sconB [Abortiporus biennis]
MTSEHETTSTLYVPIASPPTPAPSPRPSFSTFPPHPKSPRNLSSHLPSTSTQPSSPEIATLLSQFSSLSPPERLSYLADLLHICSPQELLFISSTLSPLLKRDFLRDLPPELGLHILSYIDDPTTLGRASCVNRYWNKLVKDDSLWRRLFWVHGFMDRKIMKEGAGDDDDGIIGEESDDEEIEEREVEDMVVEDGPHGDGDEVIMRAVDALREKRPPRYSTGSAPSFDGYARFVYEAQNKDFHRNPSSGVVVHGPSFKILFKHEYITLMNWRSGGHILRTHRIPVLKPNPPISSTSSTTNPSPPPQLNYPSPLPPTSAIPTSLAMSSTWVVVGLANSRIHIFSAKTGVLARTLVGHSSGVWAVGLVREGGGGFGWKEDDEDVWDEDLTGGIEDGGRSGKSEGMKYAIGWEKVCELKREKRKREKERMGKRRKSMSDSSLPSASSSTSHRRDGWKRKWRKGAKRSSDPTGVSEGWGQPNALVVSGGCDKDLKVWDVKSGYCIQTLSGHTSTIRCLKVLHNLPIVVTGSRDRTIRVWNVLTGKCLHTMTGHTDSVRCVDVWNEYCVSGSYDHTVRVWKWRTGECVWVLRGHFSQIYCVAVCGWNNGGVGQNQGGEGWVKMAKRQRRETKEVLGGVSDDSDGEDENMEDGSKDLDGGEEEGRIVSGGLDTTVRIWDLKTGKCLTLLQGHTALVCQLQLTPTLLATGGSDGRVILFSLKHNTIVQRISAHDSSVTSIQLNDRFLVTGGNDGRVSMIRLSETTTGFEYVREMSEVSESVWKVGFRRDVCAIVTKRAGKTVMEIWSFRD